MILIIQEEEQRLKNERREKAKREIEELKSLRDEEKERTNAEALETNEGRNDEETLSGVFFIYT